MVDDNFHFMDEDERYCAGEFATYEEALAAAKRIVEESVATSDSSSVEDLIGGYEGFGEDPFIVAVGGAPEPRRRFSAWGYAKRYARALAAKRAASKRVSGS